MPAWVRTDDGSYVNLDHCVEVRPFTRPTDPRSGQSKETAYRIFRTDGTSTTASGFDLRTDMLSRVCVPAAAGAKAVLLSVDDTAGRPDEGAVEVYEVIVAAWTLTQVGDSVAAMPVFVDPPASNQTVLLPQPDGWLSEPFLGAYQDLDAAKLGCLREAQEAWDRKHARALEVPG